MGEAGDQLEARADHIERQIANTRGRLEDRLSAIEERTREAVSVRRRVAQHPWAAVGGAVALGFVVGLVRRRQHQ